MASVQDLKRRIKSVRNTRKITRAMELVAAAKLRRAEARISAMRPYAETMAELMRFIGVSDCQMQEGSLRCDANVNIHIQQPGGGHVATPIVEIKNLNSFRFLEAAIRYEAQRQYETWRSDPGYVMGSRPKATAGWDEKKTVFQRQKEEAADYRYFPEPDLVPIIVDEAWKEKTGDPSPMEEDMLDFAFDVRPTSRLSCQIKVSAELDGLKVTVPERQA